MTPRPDEHADVIIHQSRGRFEDRDYRDTWTIWLEGEKQGERDSLEAAIELAGDVAAAHSRPAWLLDETGYPLEPIERGVIHRGCIDAARPLPDLDKATDCPRCGSIGTLKIGETRSSTWLTCKQCDHAWLVRRSARHPGPSAARWTEAQDYARPAAGSGSDKSDGGRS